MDSQDHKMTATSIAHEGHEVHLCHRCGWPFPNPHPSAKHRRAHKRVCGTIEGYKIIHSDHLAVSDDEHASDEDEHTPSPKLVKKTSEEFGGSGRVGEKSTKSEDDVFSDAVTEFSDSGISPRLEERFESVRGLDKSMERKNVEADLYGSESLKVDETSDRTEQFNDPTRSEEMSNPRALVNANNQSGSVIPITDTSAEAVSVGLINGSQPDLIKSEILRDVMVDNINEYGDGGSLQGQMKAGQDADIQGKEDKLATITLDSEDGKISDPALTAAERKEELCDKLITEVVKHDLPPQNETLQNLDASSGVKSVARSAEISSSTKTVGEIALVDETHENIDASLGVTEVSHSTEDIGSIGAVGEKTLPEESLLSTPPVKPVGRTQTSDATEQSDAVSMVSSTDKEVKPKTSLAGGENAGIFDASEGEKCDMDGNDKWKLESNFSVDTVSGAVDTLSAPGSAENTSAPEDDQTTEHCDEKSNSKLLESRKENGEGASEEVHVMLDSTMPSDNSTNFPSSYEVDSDPRNLEELSKTESSSLDSRDNGFEKSFQALGTGKFTEVLQSVGSAGLDSELSHDVGDVLDKNSPPTATLEDPVSPVISELPNNIHVTSNVARVESVDVAGTVTELKDNDEVVASERIPEQPTLKESTSLFTDSKLLSENSANDNSCVSEGARASESIDAAEVSAKLNHDGNIIALNENSESPTPRVQEDLPAKKCSNETSSDVEERHPSADVSTSKSVCFVSSAELTCDGNVVTSDKCSVTPSLKEPVPSPLDFQDLHETSATGNDKNVINVEVVAGVNSKSLQDDVDHKLTKKKDGVSALDLSGSSSSRSDSLEGNCGSVSALSSQSNMAVAETNSQSPDTLETTSQKHKPTTEEAHLDKSDIFEPPSFMTLVQSGGDGDQITANSEIEMVQNNQQPKSDALQAGWFPSLTNVSNESEGRKKNEEIIAKVTNWSPVKQHGPLKNLLNEVKSPNTKQVPAANQKDETEPKDNGAGVKTVSSVLGPEAPAPKDQDTNKDMEEWNSPARYPIEIKKEKKKKGKSYWVPFVCCTSVHRDL
ncbi:hypothetical protein Pfo_026722 [Paulownia fortunei]|nr:hypothetical protein Pfo_026722 [Paulownia fortunei]